MGLFSNNKDNYYSLLNMKEERIWELERRLKDAEIEKFAEIQNQAYLEKDIKKLLDIIINHREMTEEEKDHFAEEYQEYFVKNIVRKSLDSKEK